MLPRLLLALALLPAGAALATAVPATDAATVPATVPTSADPAHAGPPVPGPDPVLRELSLPRDAAHRAIFCGAAGTETSAPYARALAADLRRLERTGLSTREALARLQQRLCGASPRARPTLQRPSSRHSAGSRVAAAISPPMKAA